MMAGKLAVLYLTVVWKVEVVSDGLGYFAEEISKYWRYGLVSSCYLKWNMRGKIKFEGWTVKQKGNRTQWFGKFSDYPALKRC